MSSTPAITAISAAVSRSYLPEVDGLRACAALAVVAYHMNLLPVGWAGVWLFFVLSGFVITWMLMGADWQLTPGSYLGFARRRAARIWPLYFLYAAVSLAITAGLGGARLWGRVLGLLTFTFNFHAAQETEFSLFHHLWTISVEQQFYLFYPLVFAAARRRGNAAPVITLVAVALVLRVAEFLFARSGAADGLGGGGIVFYWSFGQFDAFGVGALIALHAPAFRRPPVYRAVLCLGLIVAGGIVAFDAALDSSGRGLLYALTRPFIFPTKLPYEGALPVTTYVVVAALAMAALATAIGPDSIARRTLRWKPLVRVGRISYGLYIWHMLVVTGVFAACGTTFATASLPLRLGLALPCFALSIGAAHLSYWYFEIRFHRRIGSPPPVMAHAGLP